MKKYDAVATVGSYTDRNGQEKKRRKNIGTVMEGRDGSLYMMLDPTFNPAGVQLEQGRDSVMVNFYAPRDNNGGGYGGQQGGYGGGQGGGYGGTGPAGYGGSQGGYGGQQGGGYDGYGDGVPEPSQRQPHRDIDDEIPF